MALHTELTTPTIGKYSQPTGLWIDNRLVAGVEGKEFRVINPTDRSVICRFSEATEKDVDIAVAAARRAFEGEWSQFTPQKRAGCLSRLAALVEEKAEMLAAVESLDTGKPIRQARAEMGAVSDCLRYYGGWADKIQGETVDVEPGMYHWTIREPMGVCGQIIPWNFPLIMLAWKISPALAAGNTVVLKTSELTPLSAIVLAGYTKEAGFPPGVVNIISGFGSTAGAAIASHMDVDKVAFTGSTAVGRAVMQAAATSNLKKVSLELGGKSPNIIFGDADIDKAVEWAHNGVFFNCGQCCTAGSRILVQESIYDRFVSAFKTRTLQGKVGDPSSEETCQGPLISECQRNRVMGFIERAKQEGAKIEAGGDVVADLPGYYIQPTILSNARPEMESMKEEIFGPVCAISSFKTEDEAVALGNNTRYGLAAAVHTKDLNIALRMTKRLRSGTVWVNCYNLTHHQLPFGGFKQSGLGRELGEAALAEYTQSKAVAVMLDGRV